MTEKAVSTHDHEASAFTLKRRYTGASERFSQLLTMQYLVH